MKLTETQHKNIINYLIGEGLEYKEFIDEMTDHFIDSIEAKMGEGMSFFYALEETGNAFKNEIYYPFPLKLFPRIGLKAMEKRFYESKKREIDADLKVNFKTSFFSIPNVLVLCYIGLVHYFLREESSLQDIWLIYAWMLPSFLTFTYLRIAVKEPMDNVGGIGWLFASKQRRVRSVHLNLLMYVNGSKWLGWFNVLVIPLHYFRKYDYVPAYFYFYSMLFIITITLLVQVQAIKMIPKVNKLLGY